MVVYSLYYFPVRNLAEPIRMLFHYHNQKFEDIRITQEEWVKRKSGFFKISMGLSFNVTIFHV